MHSDESFLPGITVILVAQSAGAELSRGRMKTQWPQVAIVFGPMKNPVPMPLPAEVRVKRHDRRPGIDVGLIN